ncbi:MAG: hypothetical protein JRI25_23415 [Deltaproteobacteria bacterium]|nr:hypothetical protein [Deltaproteobacteria bacterium]
MPEADQIEAVEVDVPATWWRIEGKRVLPEAHPVRATRIALPRLVLSGEDLPEVRDKIRLALNLGEVGSGSAEDLYATVCSADPSGGAEVHLTSVPEAAQAHLDALLARAREA